MAEIIETSHAANQGAAAPNNAPRGVSTPGTKIDLVPRFSSLSERRMTRTASQGVGRGDALVTTEGARMGKNTSGPPAAIAFPASNNERHHHNDDQALPILPTPSSISWHTFRENEAKGASPWGPKDAMNRVKQATILASSDKAAQDLVSCGNREDIFVEDPSMWPLLEDGMVNFVGGRSALSDQSRSELSKKVMEGDEWTEQDVNNVVMSMLGVADRETLDKKDVYAQGAFKKDKGTKTNSDENITEIAETENVKEQERNHTAAIEVEPEKNKITKEVVTFDKDQETVLEVHYYDDAPSSLSCIPNKASQPPSPKKERGFGKMLQRRRSRLNTLHKKKTETKNATVLTSSVGNRPVAGHATSIPISISAVQNPSVKAKPARSKSRERSKSRDKSHRLQSREKPSKSKASEKPSRSKSREKSSMAKSGENSIHKKLRKKVRMLGNIRSSKKSYEVLARRISKNDEQEQANLDSNSGDREDSYQPLVTLIENKTAERDMPHPLKPPSRNNSEGGSVGKFGDIEGDTAFDCSPHIFVTPVKVTLPFGKERGERDDPVAGDTPTTASSNSTLGASPQDPDPDTCHLLHGSEPRTSSIADEAMVAATPSSTDCLPPAMPIRAFSENTFDDNLSACRCPSDAAEAEGGGISEGSPDVRIAPAQEPEGNVDYLRGSSTFVSQEGHEAPSIFVVPTLGSTSWSAQRETAHTNDKRSHYSSLSALLEDKGKNETSEDEQLERDANETQNKIQDNSNGTKASSVGNVHDDDDAKDNSLQIRYPKYGCQGYHHGGIISKSTDVLVEVSSATEFDDIEVIKCMGLEEIGLESGIAGNSENELNSNDQVEEEKMGRDQNSIKQDSLKQSSKKTDKTDKTARTDQTTKDETLKTDKTDKSNRTDKTDATGTTLATIETKGEAKLPKSASKRGVGRIGRSRIRAAASSVMNLNGNIRERSRSKSRGRSSINLNENVRERRSKSRGSRINLHGNIRERSRSKSRGRSRSKSIGPSQGLRFVRKKRQHLEQEQSDSKYESKAKDWADAVSIGRSHRTSRSTHVRKGLSNLARSALARNVSTPSPPLGGMGEMGEIIITPAATSLSDRDRKYKVSRQSQDALSYDEPSSSSLWSGSGGRRGKGLSQRARSVLERDRELEETLEEIEVSFGTDGRRRSTVGERRISVSQKHRARSKKMAMSESSDSDYSYYNSANNDGSDSDSETINEDSSSSCRKDCIRYNSDREHTSDGDSTRDGSDNGDEFDSSSFVSETYSSHFEGYCNGQGDCSNDSEERESKRRNCKFEPFGIPQEEIIEDLYDAYEDAAAQMITFIKSFDLVSQGTMSARSSTRGNITPSCSNRGMTKSSEFKSKANASGKKSKKGNKNKKCLRSGEMIFTKQRRGNLHGDGGKDRNGHSRGGKRGIRQNGHERKSINEKAEKDVLRRVGERSHFDSRKMEV